MRNLLHNALKFTERGHVTLAAALTPRGRARDRRRGHGLRHPGRARIDYIFEMFRQVPGSGGGGVGLGLHIVRRFVEVLGGPSRSTSTLGVGTCFHIVLPRIVASATAARKPIARDSRATRAVA